MYQRLIAVIVVLTFFAGCATASGNPPSVVVPEGFETTYNEFQYAPAVRAGSMLYLSGVVARVEDGEASMVPAIERAFDEIEAILSHGGAQWSDVVDVTSYMTDLDAQIGPLWQVKGQRVNAPYPAWTAIGVERLYGGDAAIIEIKVTAYLPDGRTSPPVERKKEKPTPTRPQQPRKEKSEGTESDHDSPFDVDYDRQ